jgi:SAM-dependent methyltransferase
MAKLLQVEQRAHDVFYSQRSRYETDGGLHFSREIYEQCMAYPWQCNFDLYSEETLRLIRYVDAFKVRKVVGDGPVLEYGCGRGDLSCYLALKGYGEVYGFDISAKAIELGQRLVKTCSLQDKIFLQQMNAQELKYPSEKFALVIGKGVLHHISKYPGTSSELHRVMKPGAVAIFLENLGNGPVWETIRRISMGDTELGDIDITTKWLREWTTPFQDFKLRGFHLLFMAKRFCFIREEKGDGSVCKRNRFSGFPWLLIKALLTGCYLFDELLVNHTPIGNYLGGMCIITLRK